ncbi:MAG: c-type cytochrome domain-containing protein, partial [Planctomyces sp.]
MPSELRTSVLTALFVVTLTAASAAAAETKRTIDFSREIRPILADSCFKCHGPDEQQRTSGLRLDTQEGALAEIDGRRAIVPGDPAASELLKRIHSQDPELRMPPSDAGRDLTPQQRALLDEGIRKGASW